MAYIADHVAFIEQHRDEQRLFVATVDAAKSQEFDTVIFLGIRSSGAYREKNPLDIPKNNRLYVVCSRARDRLFLLSTSAEFGKVLPPQLFERREFGLDPVESIEPEEIYFPF